MRGYMCIIYMPYIYIQSLEHPVGSTKREKSRTTGTCDSSSIESHTEDNEYVPLSHSTKHPTMATHACTFSYAGLKMIVADVYILAETILLFSFLSLLFFFFFLVFIIKRNFLQTLKYIMKHYGKYVMKY